jgi:chromatin remodeling complex protein RSC6
MPSKKQSEPHQEETHETQEQLSLSDQGKELVNQIEEQIKSLKELKTQVKAFVTLCNNQVKTKKKIKRKGEYKPHGFTKPVNISPELADFLDVDPDTKVARP